MISFENTEIAFRIKNNTELKQSYLLFKTLASNTLVKAGSVFTNAALKVGLPISWAVKPTIYKHFVGGETIESCTKVVNLLGDCNVKSILDYSVEGHHDAASIENALAETLRTIENVAKEPNIPYAVFKPTAFATSEVLEKAAQNLQLDNHEKLELEAFKHRIDILCKRAFELNTPILIDAEDFVYQNLFDEVLFEMMEKYNTKAAIVYNTLQMYRTDRFDFLKNSLEKAKTKNFIFGAKLVRGAYMEKERERASKLNYASPIHPDKESTDKHYDKALEFCIENIDRIHLFNGTHNEKSCILLTQLIEQKGLAKNDPRIYFSQLYGMSDHISFNLAVEGYNVAKYVPYGPIKHVLPYLIRRAEENTSVKGQTGRELNLIMREMNRRKKST
jgi:proline dehydrogenase